MRRGMNSAANSHVCFGLGSAVGRLAGTCRVLAVAILLLLAHAPALAEDREIFIKAGPVFPLGQGRLEDRVDTGWTIQAGERQALSCTDCPLVLFGELGGGYTANGGDEVPVVTSGTFYAPFDNHMHPLDSFFDTRLLDLQRFSFHAALGAYYHPLAQDRRGQLDIHLNLRLGARAGGVDADYMQTKNPVLRALELGHASHGHNPALFQYRDDVEPGFLFGVFSSVGLGLRCHDACLAGFRLRDVTFGAEVEFGHDWFDLGDFAEGDDGLATISPLLTWAFSY